ncbi:hypothetical protein IFO69_21370 [Echinicola sp. CAU 1574]|uniref:Uncharacterized protein n=1 Tax=Echinicola arenosa TaxID=2774144 RepID=A0ABR9ARB5_9BACT|nr:hypothetical protein [Echinicola arenosa]MBD8491317.1 hypothetical protein [Echinicola arenosa]
MKHFYKYTLLMCCQFSALYCFGQLDGTNYPQLEEVYNKIIPYPQEVSSGGQYASGKSFHIEGTPYISSQDFVYGEITINGQRFEHIILNYDVESDQLVTYHPNTYQRIILDAKKVQSFTMENNRSFASLDANPGYIWHRNGYYEVLWDDEICFLAKHYKISKIKKDFGADNKQFEFEHHQHYFIRKGDQIHRINTKKDVAEVLGMPKKEIKRIIREKGLQYKKNTPECLVAIADFYTNKFNKN